MKPTTLLTLLVLGMQTGLATAQTSALPSGDSMPLAFEAGTVPAGSRDAVPAGSIPEAILRADRPGLYYVDGDGRAVRLEAGQAVAVETEPGLSGKRRTVLRLSGTESANTLSAMDVLYLRTDSDSTALPAHSEHHHSSVAGRPVEPVLVRLQAVQGRREVETMIRNCYVQRNGIAPERIVPLGIDRLADNMYKLTPEQLTEGEYALLLTSHDPLAHGPRPAYDFGIH
jgi:hypothetical protein